YYLTRANPLEQNIRIYRVVKGVRQMLQNFDQIIDVRRWHNLRVIMNECRVQVYFDEKKVFELCDETFKEGLVGLWTKSDAVTYFYNLRFNRPYRTVLILRSSSPPSRLLPPKFRVSENWTSPWLVDTFVD